jgi:hypothetical protein
MECKLCSGCKKSHYCSKACSKADWPTHKAFCKAQASRDGDKKFMVKCSRRVGTTIHEMLAAGETTFGLTAIEWLKEDKTFPCLVLILPDDDKVPLKSVLRLKLLSLFEKMKGILPGKFQGCRIDTNNISTIGCQRWTYERFRDIFPDDTKREVKLDFKELVYGRLNFAVQIIVPNKFQHTAPQAVILPPGQTVHDAYQRLLHQRDMLIFEQLKTWCGKK